MDTGSVQWTLAAIFAVCVGNTALGNVTYRNHFSTGKEHLRLSHVKKLCLRGSRDALCGVLGGELCALRVTTQGAVHYKTFTSSCYMYLANLCDYPGEEYLITSSGNCEDYLEVQRRGNNVKLKINDIRKYDSHNSQNGTVHGSTNSTTGSNGTKILRQDDYDSDETFAYDPHKCPVSCIDTYSPVCVLVNRGTGLYFKYYTFLNHCLADKYYCEHRKEFQAPPDDYKTVVASPLSWTYCGSNRYLQFARFSESVSSMGHYGWLLNEDPYTKIQQPKWHPSMLSEQLTKQRYSMYKG